MKRFIFVFTLMLSMALSASAQTAVQTSKVFDNVSVGVTFGATTPMSLNSMFPLNAVAGIRLQKDFTTVFGLQAEGLAFLNANNGKFIDPVKTTVKATNVGVNGVINLTNALFGYKGSPRLFEVSTVTGLGWIHEWGTSTNFLSGKTGFDLALNLGKSKAHSIVITPAIYWNLNKLSKIEFNKQRSQFALMVSYVYHFETSNGTHAFKTWDIGALNGEINQLRAENKTLQDVNETLIDKLKAQPVDTVKTQTVVETKFTGEWVVFFAKNSAKLTDEAKQTLSNVEGTVSIVATASPEGAKKFNQLLSEKRAQVVADFLKAKGVTVKTAEGLGAVSSSSNRVAIVKVAD